MNSKTCGKIDKTCNWMSTADNSCWCKNDCIMQNDTELHGYRSDEQLGEEVVDLIKQNKQLKLKQFNQSLRKYIRRCYDNIESCDSFNYEWLFLALLY